MLQLFFLFRRSLCQEKRLFPMFGVCGIRIQCRQKRISTIVLLLSTKCFVAGVLKRDSEACL